MGRYEADITKWIAYFVEGMAVSFESVLKRMQEEQVHGVTDSSPILRKLDPKQRKVLELFQQFDYVTSRQVGGLFGFKPRTSSSLCASWVAVGFLKIVNPSNRGRKYALSEPYSGLIR